MTADKWTDQELKKLENRIAREYKKAETELKEKAEDYFKKYEERWQKEYIAFQEGKYTEEQFKAWEISQLGRGAHWEDLKDQMTERLAQTSMITQDLVNGKLPSVYTKNSNEIAKIAQDSAVDQGVTGIRFDLADEYAVKRLMEGSTEVRPFKPIAIDLPKTNSYNYTKLQNALLQGILQGDSIDHLADRFMKVSEMNRSSAIRNARTAVTGAQSAGKQDRYADIASKGGEVFKMWISTDDERTREEHSQAGLDYGSEETAIPYDEPFEVGGEELMYPADSSGSPWNIYNCRCTTRSKILFKSILSDEMRERANIRLVDEDAPNEANSKPQASPKRQNVDLDSLTTKQIQDILLESEYSFGGSEYANISRKISEASRDVSSTKSEIEELKEQLKNEQTVKPREQWTIDDEIHAMLGDKPMSYTERGEEINSEIQELRDSLREKEARLSELSDEFDKIDKNLFFKEFKEWDSEDHPFEKGDANKEYAGFSTKMGIASFDEDLREGIGFIAEMSPDEYLARISFEIFGSSYEKAVLGVSYSNIVDYAKQMQSGTKFDMGYLDYIGDGQEGRHRAIASKLLGIETIPVYIRGKR